MCSLCWSLFSMSLHFHSNDATTHVFSTCEGNFIVILMFLFFCVFCISYCFTAVSFYSTCCLRCYSRFAFQLQLLLLLNLRNALFSRTRAKKKCRSRSFVNFSFELVIFFHMMDRRLHTLARLIFWAVSWLTKMEVHCSMDSLDVLLSSAIEFSSNVRHWWSNASISDLLIFLVKGDSCLGLHLVLPKIECFSVVGTDFQKRSRSHSCTCFFRRNVVQVKRHIFTTVAIESIANSSFTHHALQNNWIRWINITCFLWRVRGFS